MPPGYLLSVPSQRLEISKNCLRQALKFLFSQKAKSLGIGIFTDLSRGIYGTKNSKEQTK